MQNDLTIKKKLLNVVYVGAYKAKRNRFLAPGDFGPVTFRAVWTAFK